MGNSVLRRPSEAENAIIDRDSCAKQAIEDSVKKRRMVAAEHSTAMGSAIEILLVHEVVSLSTDKYGLFTLSDIGKFSQLSTSISHVVRGSSMWAWIFHKIRSAGNDLKGQRLWGNWYGDNNIAVMSYMGDESLMPFFAQPDRRIVERVGWK